MAFSEGKDVFKANMGPNTEFLLDSLDTEPANVFFDTLQEILPFETEKKFSLYAVWSCSEIARFYELLQDVPKGPSRFQIISN